MTDTDAKETSIQIRGMAPLLQVFDMPASIAFYRDLLGFEVADSSGEGDDVDWVLLRLDKMELMLNTAYEKGTRPPVPDAARLGAHADTAIYFDCPDVVSAHRHLLLKGVNTSEPVATSYGWKAIYVPDPDGYMLCFHWPTG